MPISFEDSHVIDDLVFLLVLIKAVFAHDFSLVY